MAAAKRQTAPDVRVISIGTLAANPLWGEAGAPRTGHTTTTLIRSGDRTILIDPGLPEPALDARLRERTGQGPEQVTHVFLTSFRPDHRRALRLFDHATWWISEAERETLGQAMIADFKRAQESDDEDVANALREEIAVLRRFEAAPDDLAPHVQLFPLPGRTPGTCGVLVALPAATILICGDAVPTIEHFERGQVLQDSVNLDQARESFAEAVEIADFLILGRDNLTPNLTRRGF